MPKDSYLTPGQKAALTRKRRAAGKKAAITKKRRAAGKKAAQTRKRRKAGRMAAEMRFADAKPITIVDLSKVQAEGKRGAALATLTQSKTVGELKTNLASSGLRGYAGWTLKTATKAGAITVG